MQGVLQPDSVAFDHRLVQAVYLPQLRLPFGCQLDVAGNEIPGGQRIQTEDQKGSGEHNDQHVDHSFAQISAHGQAPHEAALPPGPEGERLVIGWRIIASATNQAGWKPGR
ncbi:hypothetical protein D3C76_1492090 [compost metagenome]